MRSSGFIILAVFSLALIACSAAHSPSPLAKALARPDAKLVLEADGRVKLAGPHIQTHPYFFTKDGRRHDADMSQPVGTAVGAAPTLLTPANPSDIGSTINVAANLLFSIDGQPDVFQGQLSDCYYLAPLDALNHQARWYITQLALKRPDGTFGFTYRRNLSTPVTIAQDYHVGTAFARINPATGAAWVPLAEKGYGFYRSYNASTGQSSNTMGSLNWGGPWAVFADLGCTNIAVVPTSAGAFTSVVATLGAGKPVCIVTNSVISGGVHLVPSHAYPVFSADATASPPTVTLRDPWGNLDPWSPTGLVTLPWPAIVANCPSICEVTGFAPDVKKIPGDINGDGKVDATDLSILSSHWQQKVPPNTNGDLNGDGVVDVTDLSILAANWQKGN